MKINYKNINNEDSSIDISSQKSIIILGANGSGKSSLGRKIANDNIGKHLRIPSQKDLFIPKKFDLSDDETVIKNIGKTRMARGKNSFGNRTSEGNNEMIDDFSEVITALIIQDQSEYAKYGKDTSHQSKPKTKFDRVKEIFEKVFPGVIINIDSHKIKLNDYDLDDISDGERSAIYLISKCILDDNSELVIVDEPESHLNSALLNELWDLIEVEKKNTKFVYFTHNIEFADYKNNSKRYWIRDFVYKDKWNIEEINSFEIPNDLIVRIIGVKKKKIIFCEGRTDTGTRDYELYRYLYPDFTVVPVTSGGWGDVVKYVKTLRNSGQAYNKEYFGLIDRDFRKDEEVIDNQTDKIFTLPTAIYENLFLREEIIDLFFSEDKTKKKQIINSVRDIFNSDSFLNAKNRDKIHEAAKKRREDLKLDTSKPIKVIIEVDLDWNPQEKLSHNEMLKLLKSKDITKVANYSDIKAFVEKEIQSSESDVFKKFKEFMPDIN